MILRDAFLAQAESCTRLGSPFMGRLCTLLARDWPYDSALGRKFATFTGDVGPAGASLPLRIAGGLHALVLSGDAPELAAVYPPARVDDAPLCAAVLAALTSHAPFLLEWTNSPPQTNEVRRSAVLMAAAAVVHDHFPLPVVLSELGASGGLNLMWDRFSLTLPDAEITGSAPVLTLSPDWSGPVPPTTLPHVIDRAGVDLNPLDPRNPADLLRLTAYLWADQPERLALTRAAAAVMTARVDRGDAGDWLEHRLADAPLGALHLIQHTVAWQYFPEATQTRCRAMIETTGATATTDRPLAWLSMETDGDTTGQTGAAIILRLWPGDITLHLGRADFHGRWIKWADQASQSNGPLA